MSMPRAPLGMLSLCMWKTYIGATCLRRQEREDIGELSVHDVENIAIWIFEPGHFQITTDVNVPLSGQTRHVVFERDPFALQLAHHAVQIVSNRPGDCPGLVGACLLGLVDVEGRVAAAIDEQFVPLGWLAYRSLKR